MLTASLLLALGRAGRYAEACRLFQQAAGCALLPSTAACPRALSGCAYTDPSASGTGVFAESAGLNFCPKGVDREGFPPCPRSFAQLECSSLELRSSTESKCRAGDVGGAECGICGCDTAADPAACEQAVEGCLQAGRRWRSRPASWSGRSSTPSPAAPPMAR